MAETDLAAEPDPHIPTDLRERLEEPLWKPIEAQSTLEVLRRDADFLVGMVDMTRVGRATHAVYAAHLAFTENVAELVDHLLSSEPLRARLEEIERTDPFTVPVDTVVREIPSLAVGQSESALPDDVLWRAPCAEPRATARSSPTGTSRCS